MADGRENGEEDAVAGEKEESDREAKGPLRADKLRAAVVECALRGEGFKLDLLVPIRLKEGSPIETLQFRFPRGRDWREAKVPIDPDQLDYELLLRLVSRLSGQPPSVVDELDSRDVQRAGLVVTTFLYGVP